MKISESWLREWVNPDIDTQSLVDQITMAGLEVDAVDTVAGEFTRVVVGEILAVAPHPDAEKLQVCTVAGAPDGDKQVVCGAPNARPGIKVPFALVGAKLPENVKIKKAKLRGVESMGMLCAQTELQAGEDSAGLWELPDDAPTGEDLRDYLALDDSVIDIDLTPNRSDCLSLRGLAREVGVLNELAVESPQMPVVKANIDEKKTVKLEADSSCPRYVGRIIKNIDITKPSPLWLREKLRRCGLRTIDAVVDVTNYILLELGQPMHAFDLDKLQGDITVRFAKDREQITLLDGQELQLNTDTLAICDESGAIAVAGIMGGLSTAVSKGTQNIFLESAFFSPLAIAGRARAYGLHTDSSHRFERGVDYAQAESALERATDLLTSIVGGDPGPTTVVDNGFLPQTTSVTLYEQRIQSGLGFAIPANQVEDILSRLGFTLLEKGEDFWRYAVPSFRFDVSAEEDLLEELARIYGYNRLPSKPVTFAAMLPKFTETRIPVTAVEQLLVGRAYHEVITYSFIDPKVQRLFDPALDPVTLLNPISADMSVMRTSLIPGLVTTLSYNVKRQKSRVRIFEKGLRFVPLEGELKQIRSVAGLVYGKRHAADWHSDGHDVDFYDVKGDLESVLSLASEDASFEVIERDGLHPGQTARVTINGESVGIVGALHPKVLQALDLDKPAYVFELDLNTILASQIATFTPVSKFPEVSRDIAVLVDRNIAVSELETSITGEAGEYLKNLKVFDVYSGEGIDPQRKSVAFSLTFQHPSRTLNEDEVNGPMALIVKRLEDEFDARLR